MIMGLLMLGCSPKKESIIKPNIIYILADDMGYGDVSFLNKDSKIVTPNIDWSKKIKHDPTSNQKIQIARF